MLSWPWLTNEYALSVPTGSGRGLTCRCHGKLTSSMPMFRPRAAGVELDPTAYFIDPYTALRHAVDGESRWAEGLGVLVELGGEASCCAGRSRDGRRRRITLRKLAAGHPGKLSLG